MSSKPQQNNRWYLGGIAGCMAATVTHPFDLLKVQLQTQRSSGLNLRATCEMVLQKSGALGFYNGISASILRQSTYTTTRFGVYELISQRLTERTMKATSFHEKVLISGVSGALGGVIGNPADVINVRMQNDVKLDKTLRRNYKNVLDGLYRVCVEEGPSRLMSGYQVTATRGCLMTVGQVAFYEQVKHTILKKRLMNDNISAHLVSSITAALTATLLTAPLDVVKTRVMNSGGKDGGLLKTFALTAKEGPTAFFKGIIPAFIRLGPQTVLTFVFLEQLRKYFPKS